MDNYFSYDPYSNEISDDNGITILPNWSDCGYEYGNIEPPKPERVINLQESPYNIDPTGKKSCTLEVNQALQDAWVIVQAMLIKRPVAIYFGEGIFRFERVHPTRCINNIYPYVGMVGAGPEKTTLYYADEIQRDCSLIRATTLSGAGSWLSQANNITRPLAWDISKHSKRIELLDASGINVGDYIVVATDLTTELIAEYGASDRWAAGEFNGQRYQRRVTAIQGKTLTVDVQFPLDVKLRDFARLGVISQTLPEYQHYEDFSVSVKPLSYEHGELEAQDTEANTLVYRCAGHSMFNVANLRNCVFRNIGSVSMDKETSNPQRWTDDTIHIPSNGLSITNAYLCTIDNVFFANPSSHSGGGNGYLINMTGNCNVVKNSHFYGGRHNNSLNSMITSLIVYHNNLYEKAYAAVDNHRHLSHAILYDSCRSNEDAMEMWYRPFSGVNHYITSEDCWIWNHEIIKHAANTGRESFNVGFPFSGGVIGTRGKKHHVRGRDANTQLLKYINRGELLEPKSLYLDQLRIKSLKLGV